jgi:LacI family transcriptional regulator
MDAKTNRARASSRRSRSSGSVTLAHVAKDAGVSIMTVSNVVSNKHDLVKLETRRRVEESIARLNYRPNVSARSLRLSQQLSVGIVISDRNPFFLTDPFISRLVSSLSNYLSERDYTLDVQGVVPERFENASILRKSRNDALCAILCGPQQLRKAQFEYLQRLGPPGIVLQECFTPQSPNFALIRQDDLAAGTILARYLLRKRVRSVVFLRPLLEWNAVEQREKGLRSIFSKHGSAIDVRTLVAQSEEVDAVQQCVHEYLDSRTPDVIVAATDSMAAAVLKACEIRGLEVPKHLRVAGFNGFDQWCYTRPTLTTVKSPAHEMGRLAGELLLERLRDKVFSKRSVVLPVALQEGESA